MLLFPRDRWRNNYYCSRLPRDGKKCGQTNPTLSHSLPNPPPLWLSCRLRDYDESVYSFRQTLISLPGWRYSCQSAIYWLLEIITVLIIDRSLFLPRVLLGIDRAEFAHLPATIVIVHSRYCCWCCPSYRHRGPVPVNHGQCCTTGFVSRARLKCHYPLSHNKWRQASRQAAGAEAAVHILSRATATLTV